jgi:DNA-binding XRE family transcriptional regulator
MSTSSAASVLNCAAARRCASAKSFGENIRLARLNAGRCTEELAPMAGLTTQEWQAIESGQLPDTWEQVLLIAMVLRIGPKWMKHLRQLCEEATRQEPHLRRPRKVLRR